jgi:hypothetical protein
VGTGPWTACVRPWPLGPAPRSGERVLSRLSCRGRLHGAAPRGRQSCGSWRPWNDDLEVGRRGGYAGWEVRQNAVWRRGRVFLGCPRCGCRCTRVYIPLEDSSPACRRCWGLSYESRQLQNYKNSTWGRGALARMFGTTQRDWAYQATADRREQRRQLARDRAYERARNLKSLRRRQRR